MYFVIEGQVQVIAGDKRTVLKTLGKGNFFGEIALFMKIKRMAYVSAKTPCIIGILKKTDIERIIRSFPLLGEEFFQEANKRVKETLVLEEKK
jgi:CRP-like cAMP-binding protein